MKKIAVFVIFLVTFPAVLLHPQEFGANNIDRGDPLIEAKIDYEKGRVSFNFMVDDKYHITSLSNGFFKVELVKNDYYKIAEVLFPETVKFGDEDVFKGDFSVLVHLSAQKPVEDSVDLEFKVGYQVCQERPSEMCFAPASQEITLSVSAGLQSRQSFGEDARDDESWVDQLTRTFKNELLKGTIVAFLLAFLLGFVASLTPCVYPVIPIVMGYVGAKSKDNKLRGFYLSLFFVLGLALVYSVLGIFAALAGSVIGVAFQNPIVIVAISAIFILMGLSMAGLFEIPVPSSISSKVQSGKKGGLMGAMLVGGISAVIAAPCAGPVIVAILAYVSQTRDVVLGFSITFVFSLGMGILFIIVGTFSGIISSLPRGGKWMSYIKYLFSILLIGGGIFILSQITQEWLTLLLWGIFLLALSVFMGLFSPLEKEGEFKEKSFKLILVLIFLLGAFLFVKALNLHYFPRDSVVIQGNSSLEKLPWMKQYSGAVERAKKEQKILLIDTYTDWCVACKKLDKYTFSDPEVKEALKNYVLLKLDFTRDTEENSELKKKLNIFGYPTIIFFSPTGEEMDRFSKYVDPRELIMKLNALK